MAKNAQEPIRSSSFRGYSLRDTALEQLEKTFVRADVKSLRFDGVLRCIAPLKTLASHATQRLFGRPRPTDRRSGYYRRIPFAFAAHMQLILRPSGGVYLLAHVQGIARETDAKRRPTLWRWHAVG
jgi:hypothetical protein